MSMRKEDLVEMVESLDNEDRKAALTFIEFLKELGGLIKFANAMNDSHMKVIKDIQLKRKKDMYYLYLYYNGSIIAEEYQSIRQKKHFQRALKEDVMILFVDKKTMKKTMSGYD